MSLELKKAIEQISKDRGLDRDMLVSTLEEAVRTSVTRKYGDDLDVEVHYSDDTGDIEVFQFKFVVDEVEDPLTQISLEEAKAIALDDSNMDESSVTFRKQKLERERNGYEYEIEFHDGVTEYDYEINAQTGEIISKSSEPYDFD